MAFISIEPNDDFQELGTLASVTFTEGTSYVMQTFGGDGLRMIEASSKPTDADGGYVVYPTEKFQYTATSKTLYVKTLSKTLPTAIYIPE